MTVFEADTAQGETPPADAVAPRDSTADAPTSIARLNATIRDFVARWNTVWVEGEITSWNVRGGNVFARLKDTRSDAQISIRIWSSVRARIPNDLAVGDHVVAAVKSDYFVKSGDFSFAVSAMKHVGLGDQLERLERPRGQGGRGGGVGMGERRGREVRRWAGRRCGSARSTQPCGATDAYLTLSQPWPASTPT